MPRYFAYGSNMSSARLEERVGDVEIEGAAVLRSHRHSFNKHGADGTAKGNIEPEHGSEVWGVVYVLTLTQFEQLDVVEGGYRRVEVSVECEGEVLEAITYTALAPASGLHPTTEYLDHYERGVREHDLPGEYWDTIRPRRSSRSWIVAVELLAIGAVGLIELPVPRAAPLLVLASLSLWIRDRSWTDAGLRADPGWAGLAAAGLVVGAASQLVISIAAGGPVQEQAVAQAGLTAASMVLLLQVAAAFASEMVFRGFLIERLEQVASKDAAIAISAIAFAWIAGGGVLAFGGALVAGLGYALLYIAGGRTLVLPIAVHIGFEATAIVIGVLS
jgi:gamma-glutamylcyclotransferase